MTDYPLWSLAFILAPLAGTLTLLVLSRRQGWQEPRIEASQPEVGLDAEPAPRVGDFRSRFGEFLRERRWELLLAAVGLAVAVYLTVFAPVQMTGRVSINPLEPGRPFFFLHWQRNTLDIFFYEAALVYNLLTGMLSLAIMTAAWLGRSIARLRTTLLWSLLSLTGAAQWGLAREQDHWMGIALYLVAVAGFIYWALQSRQQMQVDAAQPVRIPRNWEIALVLVMLAMTAFGRLYELRTLPYGIEGDEAKWTAEVVWLGIRGLPDLSGLYHRDALPTSFYMQTPFHKLLGPSMFAARLEVALFSILATLLFYFLLRRLGNQPMALLAAWLLGASIFDISASRLANVESHVKLWPILTLLLLGWALSTKRWQAYAISGIALAIGLLTYDTVWPLLLVTLLLAVFEVSRQELDLADKVRQITALLTPSFLALPLLLPYFASRISYYEFGAKGWGRGVSTLWSHFSDVLGSWFMYVNTDFLYNRQGPLLNAFILPWLVMGVIAALFLFRQRFSYWTLAWFALFMFPVPIAAHSALGRVYYPGLPAAYALAALGMYLFARDSLRVIPRPFHSLATVLALVVLIWLPLMNLYIYFNEVDDGQDRQVRRELGELAAAAAGPDTMIMLPSIPRNDEPLNNEFQMLELFMLEKVPSTQIANSYGYVALDDLLPGLPHRLTDRPNIEIVLDKITDTERAKRDDLASALQRCYPKGTLITGYFFDRYSLPASALAEPACLGTVLNLNLAPNQRRLDWSLAQGTATQVDLTCETQSTDHLWVEGETLPLVAGWQTETAFVSYWNGSGFLFDNYGSQPIEYQFQFTGDGFTYLWMRSYKRIPDDSSVQLELNGVTGYVATPQSMLNAWTWERVGPFPVHMGLNKLMIAHPYPGDPLAFMGVFIDTLVITPDETFHPEDNHYLSLDTQHFSFPGGQSSGSIPLDLDPGEYRCTATVDSDQDLVDAFGHSPVKSNVVDVTVGP